MQRTSRWSSPIQRALRQTLQRRPRDLTVSSVTIVDRHGLARITLGVDGDVAFIRLVASDEPSFELVAHASTPSDDDPAIVTVAVRAVGDELLSWDLRSPS